MSEETFNNTWPKSTRLNQQNRDKFVETVVEDIMPDENKPRLFKFCQDWGDRVYEACYRPYREQMDALPKWMFILHDEFYVNLWQHESQNDPLVKAHNGTVEFKMSKKRKMMNESHSSYSWQSNNNRLAEIPAGHEVVEAYKEFLRKSNDWDAQQSELRKTLKEVVEACNTSHQLFRAWPKAVKYAEECFPYVEPAEAKRGGQTSVSADQLDLTAKLAQTTVGGLSQN